MNSYLLENDHSIGFLEMLKVKFHSDSGHGWLEVPIKEVEAFGIKPSKYSYRDKSNFYLEEDCDAGEFLRAYQNKFGGSPTIDFMPPVNGDHPIRSFARVG